MSLGLQGLPPQLPPCSAGPAHQRNDPGESFFENACAVTESGLLSKHASLSPGLQENRVLLFYGQENINEKGTVGEINCKDFCILRD